MNVLIIFLFCVLRILNISANITLLQTPESINLQQLRHYKVLEPKGKSKYEFLESLKNNNEKENEEDEENYMENLLKDVNMQDLRNAASLFDDYEVHEGLYDSFSNVSHARAKRELGKDLANYLGSMLENLDKMANSSKKTEQSEYFDKAVEALDNYLTAVKDNKEYAKKSSLQILKQEEHNLLLVNCGGWMWYPIKKMKKVLTCKDGVIRFISRFQEKARICDSYRCKKVKL